MGQTWSQTFPPSTNYNADQIPDLSGKVMLVTGGNGSIGKEIVKALISRNAKVYMACRNAQNAQQALEELKQETGKEALFLELDLSSLRSVRRAAEEFLKKENELHVLFNNGGVMFLMSSTHALDVTEDGNDIQWGTNVVGPFLFTKLLMPALLAGARSSSDKRARILFTASIAQSNSIAWDSLTDTPERMKMSPNQRYGQSKFANVVLAREFADRCGDQGIISLSLDPGGVKSGLQRHLPPLARTLLNVLLHAPSKGALTSLWGATTTETSDLNGKYLIPWARIGIPSPVSQDPEIRRRLWEVLEEQTKLKVNSTT